MAGLIVHRESQEKPPACENLAPHPKGLREIHEERSSQGDTMSQLDVAPEPQVAKCLAEIEGYQSSQEETTSQALRRLRKQRRDRLEKIKAVREGAHQTVEDARLEAEKAARMRIVVESKSVSAPRKLSSSFTNNAGPWGSTDGYKA
ncbi:hypothetical protein B0H11DRAFT_2246839 [Mycena galericulata]|nr:hypothetical protein B0H11DRAFT_2246839 [Mycena galericulata]